MPRSARDDHGPSRGSVLAAAMIFYQISARPAARFAYFLGWELAPACGQASTDAYDLSEDCPNGRLLSSSLSFNLRANGLRGERTSRNQNNERGRAPALGALGEKQCCWTQKLSASSRREST